MFGTSKKARIGTAALLATMMSLTGVAVRPSHGATNAVRMTSTTAGSRALPGVVTTSQVTPASSGFDKCIQDDTDRSKILQFSSTTGAFQFTQCDANPPIVLTGTGTVRILNGCPQLSGRSGGSSISGGFTNGCTYGTATITYNSAPGIYQTIRLTNSNTANNTCST